jgi:multicomponent Na+:H+ antiporter subunit D
MDPNPVLPLLPVLAPIAGMVVSLLAVRWWRVQALVALAATASGTLAALVLLSRVWSAGAAVVYQSGGWPAPYGISLVADPLAAFLVLMSQTVMLAGAVYAVGSTERCVRDPIFLPLFLALAAGLCGAFLTGDLFTLFVFSELVVMAGTVLTSLSDDGNGPEAALKYFYLSLMASTFLLLACGMLYVAHGTLNMADLGRRLAASPGEPLAGLALPLLFASFMIKSAVVPFHFWQPDFHTVSPTAVSAMLSSVVVKLGVYGFLRLLTLLYVADAPTLQALLLVLGLAGMVYGGLAAIGTHNAKRVLAYSTLAQIGVILAAIGWGSQPALAAALVFAFNHSLIKAALLMLAGALASRAGVKSADFTHLTGVGRSVPVAGALFLAGGLALAGVPPTAGFVSKLLVLQSGFEAGRLVSASAIGLLGALTLVYVTHAYRRLFWVPLPTGTAAKPRGDRLLAPTLLVVLVLAIGAWPAALVDVALLAARWLADPQAYVTAVLGG